MAIIVHQNFLFISVR